MSIQTVPKIIDQACKQLHTSALYVRSVQITDDIYENKFPEEWGIGFKVSKEMTKYLPAAFKTPIAVALARFESSHPHNDFAPPQLIFRRESLTRNSTITLDSYSYDTISLQLETYSNTGEDDYKEDISLKKCRDLIFQLLQAEYKPYDISGTHLAL